MNELKNLVDKLIQNEKYLDFSVRAHLDDGKISVETNGLNSKYEEAVQTLCKEIIKKGIKEINNIYRPYIGLKYAEEFQGNLVMFLNLLLNKGYDFFYFYVENSAKVYSIKEKISNLEFREGEMLYKGKPVPEEVLKFFN